MARPREHLTDEETQELIVAWLHEFHAAEEARGGAVIIRKLSDLRFFQRVFGEYLNGYKKEYKPQHLEAQAEVIPEMRLFVDVKQLTPEQKEEILRRMQAELEAEKENGRDNKDD